MGSASSKAARTSAAKAGKNPSWAGARMPPYESKTSPGARARQPWASESKDEGEHYTPLLFNASAFISANTNN